MFDGWLVLSFRRFFFVSFVFSAFVVFLFCMIVFLVNDTVLCYNQFARPTHTHTLNSNKKRNNKIDTLDRHDMRCTLRCMQTTSFLAHFFLISHSSFIEIVIAVFLSFFKYFTSTAHGLTVRSYFWYFIRNGKTHSLAWSNMHTKCFSFLINSFDIIAI